MRTTLFFKTLTCSLFASCLFFHAFASGDDSLLVKGADLYKKGNYTDALTIFEKCVAKATQAKDTITLLAAHRNIGNIYSQTGRKVEALKSYQQSVTLAEASGNRSAAANTIQNIGTLYEELGDYKKALENYSAAEQIAVAAKDYATIADCANNKGIIYDQYLTQYSNALQEYNKALAIYIKMNNEERMALSYNNLGVVHKCMGHYEKAIECYERSLTMAEKSGFQLLVAANLTNIGNVYAMKKEYAKAIEFNKKGLKVAMDIKAIDVVTEAAESIAQNYAGMNDYRQAYEWHKKFASYKDSMINTEKTRQIAELEAKYQTGIKEKELVELRQQGQISNLKLSEQQLLLQKNRILLTGALSLAVLVIIIAALIINRQKLKQRQLYEQAVMKAELQERKRISREMHDDLGAGLTRIALISEAAKNSGSIGSELRDITDTSRRLIGSLGEIIWSLDPESKTVEQLYSYIREQLHYQLEYADMEYNVQFPDGSLPETLGSRQKRNLLLVTKEAVNNAIKYSRASHLMVSSAAGDNTLSFSVTDDGKGFDVSTAKKGNGLRNMQSRIEELGGDFTIASSPSGTTVAYSIRL